MAHYDKRQVRPFKPSKEFDPEWIKSGMTHDTVTYAEELGKFLCDLNSGKQGPGFNALTTSQIRNFFGEVRLIQRGRFSNKVPEFLLLKPKMAYAEARVTSKNRNSCVKAFRKVVDEAHSAVDTQNETDRDAQFKRYVDFMEAILAYHKAFGGRD